jgi:hypothetical protein
LRLLIAADPKAAKRNRSKRGEAQQPTARAAGAAEGSKDSFALVPDARIASDPKGHSGAFQNSANGL